MPKCYSRYKNISSFLDTLARDLQVMHPGVEGFSRTNVFRMKSFFKAYSKNPTAVGQITDLSVFKLPWGHNVVLLERLKTIEERFWYANMAVEEGWSRHYLDQQIKSDLYKRLGKAVSNFKTTLPEPNSGMVQESLKDPYVFDFLALQQDHLERDLEQGLIDHVEKMLLELGKGFALVGRQQHIVVGNEDFYIDLLFYHVKLKCYIVVELKSRAFHPKDAGQLNFYLSAVDDLMRDVHDNPTIGLILCKTKNNIIAEYALRDINKPVGVSEYETEIINSLPKNLKGNLPSVQELEDELEKKEILSKKPIAFSRKV